MDNSSAKRSALIEKLHQEACDNGIDFYYDPQTGYVVFTELYHKRRGHCCNSGCRHCPWKKDKQNKEQI